MPYPLCAAAKSTHPQRHWKKKPPSCKFQGQFQIFQGHLTLAPSLICATGSSDETPTNENFKKKKVFFFLKPEDTLITLRWFDVVIYSGAAANTVTVITLLWPQPLCQFGPPAARALKAANVTEPLNCDQFCLCRWRWTRSRSLRAPKSQSRANTHTHTYTCTS